MLNIQEILLDNQAELVIISLPRWCWNWQTGMVEGHVPKGVGVQVPPSAQKSAERRFFVIRNLFEQYTALIPQALDVLGKIHMYADLPKPLL